MKEYDVYIETDTLELVAVCKAESYEAAKEWALREYGKQARVEESE